MGKRLNGLLNNPKISQRAKDAALMLGEDFETICWCIRIETNLFMGMFLNDDNGSYLPTDQNKRCALAILNTEFLRSYPMPHEEQVEFA